MFTSHAIDGSDGWRSLSRMRGVSRLGREMNLNYGGLSTCDRSNVLESRTSFYALPNAEADLQSTPQSNSAHYKQRGKTGQDTSMVKKTVTELDKPL